MKANVLEKIIREGDVDGLRVQLAAQPEFANTALSQDKDSPYRVHPIHLICDGVFDKQLLLANEKTELAKLLEVHGGRTS